MGVPGCGKSTFALALQAKLGGEVVNSDIVREKLIASGVIDKANCQDQKYSKLVFEKVHATIDECAKAGITVYFDATNLEAKHRKKTFNIAKKYGCPVVGELLLVSREECINRINKRNNSGNADHIVKNVPWVVDLYFGFLNTQYPTLAEGFTQLNTYQNGKLIKTEKR